MEDQTNIGDQNSQQISQNPVDQPANIPSKSKINYPLIGAVALASFIVFGFGGYYLGKQSSNIRQYQNKQKNQPSPSATPRLHKNPTAAPTDQQTSALPSGWSYQDNGKCKVKFAIPPKTKPYYKPHNPSQPDRDNGKFWDFPRGVIYPNLLSKFPNGYKKHEQANAIYTTAEAAGGHISSAVSVSCIPNENNFNNQSMLAVLKSQLQKYNQNTGEKGMQADTYTIQSSRGTERWGYAVLDLIVSEYYKNSGGQPFTNSVQYTMFTTPRYIYEIKVFGPSQDPFVKETANKIFDNLSFQ
ncbi:MAG: hypothetical protein GXP43_02780 [bacterium]|nr:hypothetical protein [bacterium]